MSTRAAAQGRRGFAGPPPPRRGRDGSRTPSPRNRPPAAAAHDVAAPRSPAPPPAPPAAAAAGRSDSTEGRKAALRAYIAPTSARLTTVDNHAQTDASILPACAGFEEHIGDAYAKHWVALHALRESVTATLTGLSGTMYDLIAFKNLASKLPGFTYAAGSPFVDLVLLVGKFQRSMSLLVRQTSALFNVVFAEGVVDSMYHFTEKDLARQRLVEVSSELDAATAEITNLVSRVQTLEAREAKQRDAMEKMEVANSGLELKSASLEDQMALLFEQLADDYIYYNENELKNTLEDTAVHEKLAPARSAFGQAIDAVQQRLRYFQDVLSDISVDATSQIKEAVDEYKTRPAAGDGGTSPAPGAPGVDKTKLKSLEVHFHHLASRFLGIRDGLQTTAKELQVALLDKKKVLNLSVHHLKAYELQNNKLRAVRSKLTDTRRGYASVKAELRKAFPPSTLLTVDESGKITHYIKRMDGKDDVTTPGVSMANVENVMLAMQEEIQKLTEVVTTGDEHKHLMRTVALSIPSGHRPGEGDGGGQPRKTATESRSHTQDMHRALSVADGGDPAPAGAAADATPTRGGAADREVVALKAEYTNKLTFMREVYEDRIRSLEAKVDTLTKKLAASDPGAAPSESDLEASVAAKKKWLAKKAALLEDGEVAKRESLLRSLRDIEDEGRTGTITGTNADDRSDECDGSDDDDDDDDRRSHRSSRSGASSRGAAPPGADPPDPPDAPAPPRISIGGASDVRAPSSYRPSAASAHSFQPGPD